MQKYNLAQLNNGVIEKIEPKIQENWFQEMLNELNSAACPNEDAKLISESRIHFIGEMRKNKSDKYGDYVTLDGDLTAKFVVQCVKTGAMMLDEIDCPINAIYLSQNGSDKNGLEDGSTVFIDDQDYELFIYEDGVIDLEPVLNEFIYLNKNQYPSLLSITTEGNGGSRVPPCS